MIARRVPGARTGLLLLALFALWLPSSGVGHAVDAPAPPGGSTTVPPVMPTVGPAPPTTAQRLVIRGQRDSRPRAALWVGAVMGVGGLVGLALSLGRLGRRDGD